MNRNLKLSILAVAALSLPACLGGYAPGQDGTPPVDNSGNGGGGGTAAGGGGGTGGGGSGGGGGGGVPAVTAKDLFTANVAPILTRCSASTCHGSATLTTPTQFAYNMPSLYDNITGYSSRVLGSYDKAQATIISKITAGGHNAQTYTAAEITSIGDWLDTEHQERAATGGTTDAREKLLEGWSACMTQTDFDTAGVATAWAQKRTNNTNTACQQCHVNGSGFLANADSTRMFQILTQAKNPAGGWYPRDVLHRRHDDRSGEPEDRHQQGPHHEGLVGNGAAREVRRAHRSQRWNSVGVRQADDVLQHDDDQVHGRRRRGLRTDQARNSPAVTSTIPLKGARLATLRAGRSSFWRLLLDRIGDADVADAHLVGHALRQIDRRTRRALDLLRPLRDVISRRDVLERQPERRIAAVAGGRALR